MILTAWLVTAAFVLLTGLTLRLWLQHRTPATGFLVGAFGLLALGLLSSRLVPDDAPTLLQIGSTALSVLGIVAFPYLLFRFTARFVAVPRPSRRAADVAAALMLVVALALVPLFAPPDADPAWLLAFFLVIIVYWTSLSAWVLIRLWRAGTARPIVSRRRLRALAVSSGLLNIALAISLIGAGQQDALSAVARVVAVAAAMGFYLAFSPPAFLRHEWRRETDRVLRAAPLDVLRAEDPAAAAEAVLPTVAGLFGAPRAVFLDTDARPVATFGVADEDLDTAIEAITAAAEPHVVHQQDGWVGLRLRTGWLGVQADAFAPLFGSDERELLGSVGAFIDLAVERVALLAAERESKARVEAASREVEALLYGLSHDLRNPLVSVHGYLELLEADADDRLDDTARQYLERVRANAAYMDGLVSDLLELSRVGRTEHRTEPVALEPLVGELAAELGREHPQATIRVDTLPVVAMNPRRARQLFANLVGNALAHAGRDDVTVTVTSGAHDSGRVEVVVQDDGKGIPADAHSRVFGIFEQLSSDHPDKGSGVGLAMCQRIVEQVGGRIWLGSPAVGTAVHVELPTAAAP